MKNSFKNNFPGKNRKQNKKNSNPNFFSKNINSSTKNNKFSSNSSEANSTGYLSQNDKNKGKFLSLKRTKLSEKSNLEFQKKSTDIYQYPTNKKNFDDWIWGKHSVYEALTSERAINRIWCTSEIFSSEKFYILLKDLNQKESL